MYSAIFVILWAIDSNAHSILTLSFPRSINLRNGQQPLILAKVCSTSTALLERSCRTFSGQRFSFAFCFNSFDLCAIRIHKTFTRSFINYCILIKFFIILTSISIAEHRNIFYIYLLFNTDILRCIIFVCLIVFLSRFNFFIKA